MATTDDTRAGEAQPVPALTLGRLLSAVEAQRSRLINVLGVVQCVRMAAGDPPCELEGAVALLEENLQDILRALEGPSLKKAAAEEVRQ